MGTEEHDDLAGDSRPVADDGPFTLRVDGEIFTVKIRSDGGCDYDWESGPNEGYGFGGGPARVAGDPLAQLPPDTVDDHRESIRGFLRQINPQTGYIGD